MRRLSIPQASADTQGRLIHRPDPSPVLAQKCLSCEHRCVFARAGQEGCTLRCFSLARSARHGLGPKSTHAPPTTSSAQSHRSLSSRKTSRAPGQAGCSPAEDRLQGRREQSGSCSRAAASLTRQSCTCLPKGACTLPSLSLRIRSLFSFVLLQLHTPSLPPLTARQRPSLRSVTPLLSCCLYPSATSVSLPAARKPTHALAGCCASACRAEQQKATFSRHRYPQLPTASTRREKSACEGGICICPCVNTHDLSQRLTREKTRTLKHFPPPRHSPIT